MNGSSPKEAKGRWRSLTPEERTARLQKVAALEREGHFTNQACAMAGVPRAWFYKWKARAGDPESGGCEDARETPARDKEWIRRLILEGKTQAEVAEEVDRCRATVRRISRALGLSPASQRRERSIADVRGADATSPSNVGPSAVLSKSSATIPTPQVHATGDNVRGDQNTPYRDPEQLTGPAGKLQKTFVLNKGPFVFLFHGPPGVGKTALCEILALRLVKQRSAFESLTGKDCGVEKMRDLKSSMGNPPMFTKWRVVVIEDLDRMPMAGQDSFREMLHNPPEYCAVFASSNRGRSGFQKRLWTRFERYPVAAPNNKQIASLLAPMVPKKQVREITKSVSGNARDAILEAKAWLRQNNPERSTDEASLEPDWAT